jgi:hypothetical protein
MAVDIDGVNSTISTDKLIPQSGTALQIGDASDVITIPASATITNLGTATGFGGGKLLQTQVHEYTTQTSIASSYSYDGRSGTSPTQSTGYLILTKTFTPLSATSNLHYHVCMKLGPGTDAMMSLIHLFRDSSNTCLDASQTRLHSGGEWYDTSMCGIIPTGSTASTTLKVYVARNSGNGSNVIYTNRGSNTTTYGGSAIVSTLIIYEVEV